MAKIAYIHLEMKEIGLVVDLERLNLEEIWQVIKLMKKQGLQPLLEENLARSMGFRGVKIGEMDCDIIICIGGDKTILKTVLSLNLNQIPILGLRYHGSLGFLTEADLSDFNLALKKISDGDFIVEDKMRIECLMNGENIPPALNEIAMFNKVSATLIRYTLRINRELMWRDEADGVIVATPTGSTAYALSAGGSIISDECEVFDVVPVNSINQARRPLIVSNKNLISIEVEPPNCEIIVDGQFRKTISNKTIFIKKAKKSAKFIKLSKSKYSALSEKLGEKIMVKPRLPKQQLFNLPPSSKLVLKVLQYEGPLTQREIAEKTTLPHRTIRYALNILMSRDLVIKKEFPREIRRNIYMINEKTLFPR